MGDPAKEQRNPPRRATPPTGVQLSQPVSGGYPLSALFVLIAVAAVLMGIWAPSLRHAVSGGDADGAAFAWVVLLVPIGGMVGLFHHRRWLGLGLGMACGMITAGLVAPVTQLPSDDFATLISLVMLGSAVVVIVAMACRMAQRPPPWPDETSPRE